MKITLQNFQGHANTEIETKGGITAITGSTNAGKTSVIRALKHMNENNLRGTGYIRKGTDTCTIGVDNIKRIKGKSLNQYFVGENMTEALNKGVPVEVATALNLSSDCVQSQHDSIFLLNQSGGYCAQRFSELIDLEQAHRAIKLAEQEKRAVATTISNLNASINKRNATLENLKDIPTIDDKLKILEKKQSKIDELRLDIVTLHNMVIGVKNAKIELNSLPDVSQLTGIPELIAEHRAVSLLTNAIEIAKIMTEAVISATKNIVTIPDHLLPEIVSIKTELSSITKTEDSMESIEELSEDVKYYKAELKKEKELYKQLMGDSCPLCGGEIK